MNALPDMRQCPQHIRESIDAYVEQGRATGGFLRAVLENDLRGAIGRADEINLAALPHIVAYINERVPAIATGSAQLVDAWLRRQSRLVAEPVTYLKVAPTMTEQEFWAAHSSCATGPFVTPGAGLHCDTHGVTWVSNDPPETADEFRAAHRDCTVVMRGSETDFEMHCSDHHVAWAGAQ